MRSGSSLLAYRRKALLSSNTKQAEKEESRPKLASSTWKRGRDLTAVLVKRNNGSNDVLPKSVLYSCFLYASFQSSDGMNMKITRTFPGHVAM
jgi:hypothetical protein